MHSYAIDIENIHVSWSINNYTSNRHIQLQYNQWYKERFVDSLYYSLYYITYIAIFYDNIILNAYRIHQKWEISGSPDGNECKQRIHVEGPGMKVLAGMTSTCFEMDEKPLKVFAAKTPYKEFKPIDGVVRNVAFTNTATNTTIKSPCAVPTKPNGVLFLSTFRKANKPMVLGLNGRSLSHF